MEQELLIKDLCARLPYGIKVKRPDDGRFDYVSAIDVDAGTLTVLYNGYTKDIGEFVPYLRSLSSMTEEELKQYKCLNDALDENYEVHIDNAYPAFDWLNAHHFDYRGLIEKGLAIEAPEGMYNLNK